MMCNIPS